MGLADVVQAALEKIQYIAKTETIFGEPILAGDFTLIPVSRVSIGFAAGAGGKEASYGSGEGTGGGITVIPVAFIAVSKDKVQVLSFADTDTILTKIINITPEIISKISKFMKKDDSKQDSEKK